ncbi:MAG: ABC transporter substrate-binding protein [Dehalococcoidia bacterium]|nr:ABC transporter substrate-binding protein [Dehalococcoidia bacterium]
MRKCILAIVVLAAMLASSCGGAKTGLTKVTLMLDWVPNTNHAGIFAAQANGYFRDAGLEVKIIQPGEVYPEAAVAGGAADFGISFQEQVTMARADGASLVSIAAVLQHNTSGFASPATLGVRNPADFEGLRYGAFSSPFEEPTLRALMQAAGADYGKLNVVNIGFNDPLAMLAAGQIDLAWIFYGWQGIQAVQAGIALDVVMMKDYTDVISDYYTPVVIASEATIAAKPEVVRAFLTALSQGYEYAAANPEQAAAILLNAAPELDAATVRASLAWLAPYYIAGAPRWGEQKPEVWQDYIDWMAGNDIIPSAIAADKAFTNAFLP